MAESAVSFLLNELSTLLQEKRQLLGGLEREVRSIHDELGQLRGFLRDADAKEESDSNLKEWVSQLRDISFDLEDVLDKYMLRFGARARLGCIKRLYAAIKNLRARDQIAHEIKAIKHRLENVTKNKDKYREMYKAIDQGSSSGTAKNVWYDGRGEALFLEDDEVVGIEEPKQQLLTWIKSIERGSLDVIAVVGMGGLGKTTLVKKVFDDETVRTRFSKHVWIVASDFKDVKPFLKSFIEKLVAETKELPPQVLGRMDVDEMRDFIHESLKETNYIVVVDDIWDVSRWEAVRFAFPRRGGHGCVIITTRFSSIADAASACSQGEYVYNLKPLSQENSNVLFYKKAFPRHPCPPYLREYAENILNKCDGLPLAIVVIGGVLATKKNRAEDWERFSRSLVDESEGSGLRRLWKILSLSYNDLPYYLKYCFLYLGMFPAGGSLDKEEIVRLWIAEGFVESKQHQTMEEVAEDYLNQLSSRSLLQVVKENRRVELWFRIHDLLQEYIVEKSREQTMITIYEGRETQWPDKIRRLAILKPINSSPEMTKLKYLRSLLLLSRRVVESDLLKQLLSECRLLKVLDLRYSSLNTIPDEVFRLYHLKYLCLSGTRISLIPKEIKYLKNLETLNLERCDVTELPEEILNLHKLRHLLAYKIKARYVVMFDHTVSVKAPCSIGTCLPHLQTLCCIDVNVDEVGGVKMVGEVGKLTHLRRLEIAKVRSEDGRELCASLAKLTYLNWLKIVSVREGEKMDLDYPLSSTSLPFLNTIEFSGCIEKVPQCLFGLEQIERGSTPHSPAFAKSRTAGDSRCLCRGVEFC